MAKKIRVGIIFGGRSAEHEISVLSARNVFRSLDPKKYEPVLIGIDRKGAWHAVDAAKLLTSQKKAGLDSVKSEGVALAVVPAGGGHVRSVIGVHKMFEDVDVFFPVLHGPFGEDGTVQGLLKLLDVPYVGSGVLGSAVGMDKDVQKRLLHDAGIATAKFTTLAAHQVPLEKRSIAALFTKIKAEVGSPFFVKPANLGSSVGIHKVADAEEFLSAVQDAFRYDTKVLFEENIIGREIECSVLGNEKPVASLPGEIVPKHDFYSYEAKYLDEHGATLKIPADLPEGIIKKIQEVAVHTFKVLCLEGMTRVDFFLKATGEVLVNEVNTIPGFTDISMYPKLWEASGVPQTELIDRLIELAIGRHAKEKQLKTTV